jgi:hypothetical protein
MAAHTQGATADEPEPLFYQENPFRLCNSTKEDDIHHNVSVHNLPTNFGGPYQMHSLLDSSSCSSLVLLVTGWRADCDVLVDKAREIAALEQVQIWSYGSSKWSCVGHKTFLVFCAASRIRTCTITELYGIRDLIDIVFVN